jgi:lysophospholipase
MLNPSVASLRIFPGITAAAVEAFLSPTIRGIVLETYGTGNAPSNRKDLMLLLEEACKRGVVIVNCSQCKRATVTSLYETGSALLKIGIIPGSDMTPECALTKLAYLLGKYDSSERVRTLMQKNLRGELTVMDRKPLFTFQPISSSASSLLPSILHILGAGVSTNDNNEQNDTDIQNLEIQQGLNAKLIPIAYSHVVREGDTSSLQYLIQEYGDLIDIPTEDGFTPLHAAVCSGQSECVKILLRRGASIHLRNGYNYSPLFNSVLFGQRDCMLILRMAGAHFTQSEEIDMSFFFVKAIESNDIEKVHLVIESGANPNITILGRTPLHMVYWSLI